MKQLFTIVILIHWSYTLLAQQQNQWRNFVNPSIQKYLETPVALQNQNLWLASNGGLIHFNTQTERHTIYQPDSCNIKGVSVNAICPDTNGGVWFATNVGGLQHFDGRRFQWFNTKATGEKLNLVKKIQLDKQGRVWMLHSVDLKAEVLMFDGQNFTSFLKDSLRFDDVFGVDKEGVCWFNTYRFSPLNNHRLAAFDSRTGQMMYFDSTNSSVNLPSNISDIQIRQDKSGNTWLTYYDANKRTNLFQLSSSGLKNYRVPTHPRMTRFQNLAFSHDNTVYFFGSSDVFRFKDSILTYTFFPGFSMYHYLPVDSTQSWIVSDNLVTPVYNKLFRINGNSNKAFSFSSEKSFASNVNSSIIIPPIIGNHPKNNHILFHSSTYDGRQFNDNRFTGTQGAFEGDSLLWMAGYQNIAYFDLRSNNNRVEIRHSYVTNMYPKKVLANKLGKKWILTLDNTSFFTLTKNRVYQEFKFNLNGYNTRIADIELDALNNLWMVTDTFLVKHNTIDSTWAFLPLDNSIRKKIRRINIDEGNNIWLDVEGLCYLYSEQNGIKVLDDQQVFLRILDYYTATGKFVTYRNNYWWFTTQKGLVRYDGQNFQSYNEANSPLPTNLISNLFTDRLGNLWINHVYGLTVFNENGLVDLRTPIQEAPKQEIIMTQMSPNPLSNYGILTFANPSNSLFELTIFDINGTIKKQQQTRDTHFIIQTQNYSNGLYFYSVKSNGKIGYGKFIVQE